MNERSIDTSPVASDYHVLDGSPNIRGLDDIEGFLRQQEGGSHPDSPLPLATIEKLDKFMNNAALLVNGNDEEDEEEDEDDPYASPEYVSVPNKFLGEYNESTADWERNHYKDGSPKK